jgi:NAD(P)-dependent dehydrogenase (short-subunit alcohol dehydrogenase family)
MSTRLEHKTALVTGATSNIGRAIATAFAAEGAHVIVSGRSPLRGAEVVEQIHAAGGHAEFIAADLDGSAQAWASLPTPRGRSAAGSMCSSTARGSSRAQPRRP